MNSDNEEDRQLAINMINEESLDNFHLPDLYYELRDLRYIHWKDIIAMKEIFIKKGFHEFKLLDFV